MELEDFELEDRKHVQFIIIELFTSCTEIIVQAIHPKRVELAHNLIVKYTVPGMATFAGSLLRLFTRSNVKILSIY